MSSSGPEEIFNNTIFSEDAVILKEQRTNGFPGVTLADLHNYLRSCTKPQRAVASQVLSMITRRARSGEYGVQSSDVLLAIIGPAKIPLILCTQKELELIEAPGLGLLHNLMCAPGELGPIFAVPTFHPRPPVGLPLWPRLPMLAPDSFDPENPPHDMTFADLTELCTTDTHLALLVGEVAAPPVLHRVDWGSVPVASSDHVLLLEIIARGALHSMFAAHAIAFSPVYDHLLRATGSLAGLTRTNPPNNATNALAMVWHALAVAHPAVAKRLATYSTPGARTALEGIADLWATSIARPSVRDAALARRLAATITVLAHTGVDDMNPTHDGPAADILDAAATAVARMAGGLGREGDPVALSVLSSVLDVLSTPPFISVRLEGVSAAIAKALDGLSFTNATAEHLTFASSAVCFLYQRQVPGVHTDPLRAAARAAITTPTPPTPTPGHVPRLLGLPTHTLPTPVATSPATVTLLAGAGLLGTLAACHPRSVDPSDFMGWVSMVRPGLVGLHPAPFEGLPPATRLLMSEPVATGLLQALKHCPDAAQACSPDLLGHAIHSVGHRGLLDRAALPDDLPPAAAHHLTASTDAWFAMTDQLTVPPRWVSALCETLPGVAGALCAGLPALLRLQPSPAMKYDALVSVVAGTLTPLQTDDATLTPAQTSALDAALALIPAGDLTLPLQQPLTKYSPARDILDRASWDAVGAVLGRLADDVEVWGDLQDRFRIVLPALHGDNGQATLRRQAWAQVAEFGANYPPATQPRGWAERDAATLAIVRKVAARKGGKAAALVGLAQDILDRSG